MAISRVTRVYLQAWVEIHAVPRQRFLAFYKVLEGEDLGGISTAFRGATEREAVAFGAGPLAPGLPMKRISIES